jgi:DNA-binding XRE family transcriptional regulator
MEAKDKIRKMKTMTLDELKDQYLGVRGTPERDTYELELKVEVLGEMIKKLRKEHHLTQEELGRMVGVNKSQISKLERNTKNVTIATILKIFKALKTNVKFSLKRMDENYENQLL